MQISTKENIIDQFCNSIWIERGLSNHTIESYKRDLTQLESWLRQKNKDIINCPSSHLNEYFSFKIDCKII